MELVILENGKFWDMQLDDYEYVTWLLDLISSLISGSQCICE